MKWAEIWTVHEMGNFTDEVQNIYVFRMILRINNDYFLKQY
jgi:hypothetical protein